MNGWGAGRPPLGRPASYLGDVEVRDVKRRLYLGEAPPAIASSVGCPVSVIYNIKAGKRGYHIEWPDGSIGEMSRVRAGVVAKSEGMRNIGVSKRKQGEYDLMVDLANRGGEERRQVVETEGEEEIKAQALYEEMSRVCLEYIVRKEEFPPDVEEIQKLRNLWGRQEISSTEFLKRAEELDR